MLNSSNKITTAQTQIGTVTATNLSTTKGTAKHKVASITIDSRGVVGDAHAGAWHRQVSLLSKEHIDTFAKRTGKDLAYGAFGENITFDNIDSAQIATLDRLTINDVVLEITQIGKECHGAGCAIYRDVGKCIMPQEGLFARVVHPGKIAPGDCITHTPYTLKILVITMSDRAAQGIYADKAGEVARSKLTHFFMQDESDVQTMRAHASWHWEIEQLLLPDNADQLRINLQRAIEDKIDLIFTLGGTGIGTRDITPDVACSMCDKFLPGIMDNIRVKYGATHPAALLSRSIAGIARNNITQIYTLPGSARAVSEYLAEITKTLEHAVFMLHDIDRHG